MDNNKPDWLKFKGYVHVTPQIDVDSRERELLSKITNKEYVAKYAFFPLLHSIIKERKYKKISGTKKRAHSFIDVNGIVQKTCKERPLHYASNMDALIFGYYANEILIKYEERLKSNKELSDCIIAYRKIPTDGGKQNKGTIHFANEVFTEVKNRAALKGNCSVLTFDIKSFFPSLDHRILEEAWKVLFEFDRLPRDHFNVFKAATKFSYINKFDLKKNISSFDEKHLAKVRNVYGINSLFASPKELKEKIKTGIIKIHKNPFENAQKECIGIPQGLPISAVLANIYLYEFDQIVFSNVVEELGGFYRRYSDDIVVICDETKVDEIESFIKSQIINFKLRISDEKTEKFIFKNAQFGKKPARLSSFKLANGDYRAEMPLVYLGFEFNGKNTLIKSANVAKFYRKMIYSVKRKAKRAINIAKKEPVTMPVLYRRQLYKLFNSKPLSKTKIHSRWKRLEKIETGEYRLVTGKKKRTVKGTYTTYVQRASEIMKEPAILNQVRNQRKIFNQAVFRHFTLKRKSL